MITVQHTEVFWFERPNFLILLSAYGSNTVPAERISVISQKQ